jgi:peroxin-2
MSSASTALAAAWDNASGRLSEINEEISRFASPLSSVQRVNRLDAELLDTELVVLLRDPVTKSLASIVSVLCLVKRHSLNDSSSLPYARISTMS